MLNEPDPGPTLPASSRAEQGEWRKEARIPHSAFPTFPPLFPYSGDSRARGVLATEAGGCILVPPLPPDPKRAWRRCLLPGPRVSLPMKQGDESGSALRFLSTLLLCGPRTITILASPGHPPLSLEAGKDARREQLSRGWLQILSWGDPSCLPDTPSHQQKGTCGSRKRPNPPMFVFQGGKKEG